MHADQMADYAMAAMFMLHWDVPRILRDQAGAVWRREAKAPLAGRTLGVIGLGAIGQEIARRAQCAGMEVLGVSRSGTAVASVAEVHRQEQLQDVLPRCDFVVLVVPATAETSGLIDAEALRLMKPTASLINFARGSVVEEQALIDALRDRAIKGAVLDVFAAEPLPAESPLWSLPNVIVTPHIAGMSDDYEARFATAFAANLARYRRGEQLLNIVDLARGY
jgi:phosphoglycerate dehydrogenase-like enzyme